MTDSTKFQGWAILELLGHRRLGGYVTETELAGQGVLRIEIPAHEPEGDVDPLGIDWRATQIYSASALYCLTPTSAAAAWAVARASAPMTRYELPAGDDLDMADEEFGAQL